jgi:hypothetical protein
LTEMCVDAIKRKTEDLLKGDHHITSNFHSTPPPQPDSTAQFYSIVASDGELRRSRILF